MSNDDKKKLSKLRLLAYRQLSYDNRFTTITGYVYQQQTGLVCDCNLFAKAEVKQYFILLLFAFLQLPATYLSSGLPAVNRFIVIA